MINVANIPGIDGKTLVIAQPEPRAPEAVERAAARAGKVLLYIAGPRGGPKGDIFLTPAALAALGRELTRRYAAEAAAARARAASAA
jgi:hypothetical protein